MKRKPDTPLRAQEPCGERDASAKASATAIVHRSRAPAIRCHAYPILSTFQPVRERSPPIASAPSTCPTTAQAGLTYRYRSSQPGRRPKLGSHTKPFGATLRASQDRGRAERGGNARYRHSAHQQARPGAAVVSVTAATRPLITPPGLQQDPPANPLQPSLRTLRVGLPASITL